MRVLIQRRLEKQVNNIYIYIYNLIFTIIFIIIFTAVKNQRAMKRELKKDLKLKYKESTAKAKVNNPVDTDITARVGHSVFKY